MAATPSPYRTYRILLVIFCTLGIFVSVYAYHVETSKEKDSGYIAFCDISAYISCSKAFTSRYGKGFGLIEYIVGKDHVLNQPNSVFGIMFYVIQLLLDQVHKPWATWTQLLLSALSNVGSVYLACILYFVLSDFCIVCGAIYVINFIILVINVFRHRYLSQRAQRKREKKKSS